MDMIRQCRFILSNKCATLGSDANNGEGYACVGVGGIWETSIHSFQFCCELEAVLKTTVLK